MKRDFLNFAAPTRVGKLPKMQSRRFPGHARMGYASYETDAPAAEPEPDTRTEDQLLEKIQSKIDTAIGTRATKEELTAIKNEQKEMLKGISIEALREMADDKKGVMAMLAKQGLEIAQLRAAGQKQPQDLSLRGQIKTWMEANKDDIKAIREGKRNVSLPELDLQLRVASPMTPATVNAGGSAYIGRVEVESGINDFLRAPNVFWDYIKKGRTNAETYVWINKTNPLGAAAWLAPGELKPGVSFALEAEKSNAKKIADSAKAATELLQDIEGMASFIEDELYAQVMIKANADLMSNAGSSTVPKGIRNYSTTYTTTTIKTTNPNYMDAIRAVIGQMRANKLLKGAITVFINPIDAVNMDLAKAVDSGVYMLPPFVTASGRTIGGATIVEDPNVPVGYLQAAYLAYYRVLIYKGFSVSWGWENDDFTRNLVTAVGEMRIHQFVNGIHEDLGAFVYDSFENIVNAITAV